jgi:hypothetical protein
MGDTNWNYDANPLEVPIMFAALIGGITTPIVFLTSLIIRGGLLILGVLIGIVFYAPATILAAIARKTGADHYFRVGKYIVLVIAQIITLLQR